MLRGPPRADKKRPLRWPPATPRGTPCSSVSGARLFKPRRFRTAPQSGRELLMIASHRYAIGSALVVTSLCVALVGLRAQGASAAPDTVRLQFELTTNGSVVARPVMRIALGQPGTVEKLDAISFSVVPTQTRDGNVSLQFEFKDGPKPRMVLKGEDGSGELLLSQDHAKITVTRVK